MYKNNNTVKIPKSGLSIINTIYRELSCQNYKKNRIHITDKNNIYIYIYTKAKYLSKLITGIRIGKILSPFVQTPFIVRISITYVKSIVKSVSTCDISTMSSADVGQPHES